MFLYSYYWLASITWTWFCGVTVILSRWWVFSLKNIYVAQVIYVAFQKCSCVFLVLQFFGFQKCMRRLFFGLCIAVSGVYNIWRNFVLGKYIFVTYRWLYICYVFKWTSNIMYFSSYIYIYICSFCFNIYWYCSCSVRISHQPCCLHTQCTTNLTHKILLVNFVYGLDVYHLITIMSFEKKNYLN